MSTIRVDMEISSHRVHEEDRFIELWGYVGDYEVMVCLPIDDPRVRALRGPNSDDDTPRRRESHD